MYPPAFAIVAASPGVQALIGAPPNVRFHPFGEANPNPMLPYAVWQTVFGSPFNYLGNTPDGDAFGTQIDVFANEATEARAVAAAIRAAVEPVAYVSSYNGEFRDQVTRHYRYSFTVDWLVSR